MLQFQQRIFKYIELKEYSGFQHKTFKWRF